MKPFHIAGLGCSAGGLKPLITFFSQLKTSSETAFIVICHYPRLGPATELHKVISKITWMPVQLLTVDILIKKNNVYVLPGDLRATVIDGKLILRKRTMYQIINKAIDEFLLSLAQDQGSSGVAIIFSGTGTDGASGAKAISENGGTVLVQSPETATFSSMPVAAIRADSPEEVLSPEDLGMFFSEIILSKAE